MNTGAWIMTYLLTYGGHDFVHQYQYSNSRTACEIQAIDKWRDNFNKGEKRPTKIICSNQRTLERFYFTCVQPMTCTKTPF